MLYEIHIPQPGSDRSRVESVHGDNWLDALRRGLASAGLPAPARNLACDLQDDESVIITDTTTGRIYRVIPVRGTPAPGAMPAASIRRRNSVSAGTMRVQTPAGSDVRATATLDEMPAARDLADPFSDDDFQVPPPRVQGADAQRLRTSAAARPGREGHAPVAASPAQQRTEDLLEPAAMATPLEANMTPSQIAQRRADRQRRLDALERELMELEHLGRDIHDACNFTLDIARAHTPSGAGSVLLIDARDRCLYFAAARGPKAAIVASQRIPLEVGIAGASIRQRQPINVRDPGRDPRFASNFADSVGYHPRSLLCAPVFAGHRAFGVIELLDREQREAFSDDDSEMLMTVARKLGEHFASLLPRKG
jgi:putative methionine-R-sulfoxide reductase with GAF domain